MPGVLYSLTLFNQWQEGFFIGLFESHEYAQQTAERYLSAVPGFRDYPCTYEITEKSVVGSVAPSGKIYVVWGWNENQEGYDTDIWCSDCYTDREEAEKVLADTKQCLNRQEWSLDGYPINQCHWMDGFVRMFY